MKTNLSHSRIKNLIKLKISKAVFYCLTFFCGSALAQQGFSLISKPVPCSNLESVIEIIAKKFEEKPIWISTVDDSRIMLTVNFKTKTWSIVQFNNTLACLIDSGDNFQILDLENL